MYETLPKMLQEMVAKYGTNEIQLSKDDEGTFHPTTYSQFYSQIVDLAAGLHTLGVKRGSLVGLISDNRKEWLVSDFAILALGAADVPRGRDAMAYELEFILNTTEAKICFAENEEQAYKVTSLADSLTALETIIVIDTVHYTTDD
ncbi:MAG: AMP-binding protein, partial [Sphaerochaetaceae bacterium]